MAKKLYEESRIAAIAEKIREKTGTDETYTTAEMPSGVEAVYEAGAASGGGAKVVEEKDVNFYDYDGTLLYSYTVAEAQALTELPPAPTPPKDFLMFQEWNWTLAQIKDYNDLVQVGAIYKPIDDKTRAVIQIDEDWQKSVILRYAQWAGSVAVDWGDGSAEAPTTDNTGKNFTFTHEYAEKGTYTITIEASSTWNFGHNTASAPFFGNMSTENGATALREVYCGKGARLLLHAFNKARQLKTITISKYQTQIWAYCFQHCINLPALIVPSTLTTISDFACVSAYGLNICSFSPNVTQIVKPFEVCNIKRFVIPKKTTKVSLGMNYVAEKVVLKSGVVELGDSCCASYYSQTEITIPETVTKIGAQAFYNNYSLLRMRFLPTTPPTVTNANAFTGIPTTCVVEVPSASLAAYQAATNYASISAQMVGV